VIVLIDFFSPCPRGSEALLAIELQSIGAKNIVLAGGGVSFSGDQIVGWRANLESRFASRVLQRLNQGPYESTDDLYQLAYDTPWELFHDVDATLRVDITATRAPLQSLQFSTLRIKDGICDRYREATGERPSIDTHNPVRRVFAYVSDFTCQLYLDWSGEPLFKRGWRREANDAPMKENLAATVLALSGWAGWAARVPGSLVLPEGTPNVLLDPFCGSGTIAIEAACMAKGILPGSQRRFAFQDQLGFDHSAWQRIRDKSANQAAAAAKAVEVLLGGPAKIYASDITPAALAIARENASEAGLSKTDIEFKQSDALHWNAPASGGILVTNPPYGERIDMKGRKVITSDERFWPLFGDLMKKQFNGWQAWLFTGDLELPGHIRLKPKRRTPLFNGPIECRLFGFEMYLGTKKIKKLEAALNAAETGDSNP
jgi:putative N6-adenine-specific DNA methylase